MRAYVINLARSIERRAWMEQQLSETALDPQFVPAVDGPALSAEDRARLVDETAVARAPRWLTDGQIGCALSHLSVYREVAARTDPVALVLEDDVIVPHDIDQLAKAISEVMEPTEVVLLYYISAGRRLVLSEHQATVVGRHRLLYPLNDSQRLLSTAAYLIGRDAARNMAGTVLPIRVTADQWERFYRLRSLTQLRCAYPRPIRTTVTFASSIGYKSQELATISSRMRVLNRWRIARSMGRTKLTSQPSAYLSDPGPI